jgi:hypothetical protein
MKLNTYIIDGGIGKHIMFASLIDKLAKKAGQPIQIHTPYVNVFAFNPNVKLVFDANTISLNDPRILASDNIYYSEPYKSNFLLGKEHLIESYCREFGIEFNKNMFPKMFTANLKETAEKYLRENDITGKYVLVQFTGGQTPIGFKNTNPYISTNPGRNYPSFLAQQVINKLKDLYPDITIIDCTLPNEPSYTNTIKCTEHWILIHELLKKSEGFIGIDSYLNHMSASTKVKGVVLWGSTKWTQFGWSHNKNLSYFMENEWDNSKYNDSDPRNIMVDPDKIVENYKNRNVLSKNQTDDVCCAIV